MISRLLASLADRLEAWLVRSETRAAIARNEDVGLLRQVIDLLPHHISIRDEEGRFVLANRALAARYALTPVWLEGRSEQDLARIPIARPVSAPPPPPAFEETCTDANGCTRTFSTLQVPFRQRGRRMTLSVSVELTGREPAAAIPS